MAVESPPRNIAYAITLADMVDIADAASLLSAYRSMLVDNPAEQQQAGHYESRLHEIVQRAGGLAADIVYSRADHAPAMDYEALKLHFFQKGLADPFGRGRFESAFYSTVRMAFEQGLRMCAEQQASQAVTP